MFVMPLLKVTDAILTATNIPENDAPTWTASGSYATGQQVIAPAPTGPVNGFTWPVPRLIYESSKPANTGRAPRENLFHAEDNPEGWWIVVRAPNRWRAFDHRTTDHVIASGDITYTLTLPSTCTGISFHNLQATSITVSARDLAGTVVWTRTQSLLNTDQITDWFEFFMYLPENVPETVFENMPGYPGWRIDITLSGPNTRVGQIAVGRIIPLGDTLADTEIGFDDRSTKERDAQGNLSLVARDYIDLVSFRFVIRIGDERRVKRQVAAQAGKMALWFAGENVSHRGTTVLGFNTGGLRIPLQSAGRSFASIEIEDLT